MALAASQVFLALVKADTKGAITELKKLSGEIDKSTSGAVSKLDKFGSAATKAGVVMVSAAAAGAGAVFKLAQGASNLAESVNAVGVTFGDAADGILQLGEDAATAVGLSRAEFNGLAVQFSSFAKTVAGDGGNVVGTMDELTTRVADFASVMNLDVPEAARIFQSALAGETEPIKKFGIDLSAASVAAFAVANGISDSAASMTEAEKVTARYGLLMQSTAQTAGDFANTSDGLANQQRILSANFKNLADGIGTGALPMLTAIVSTANKAVEAFSSLSPETQGAIGKFAALGVAGLGLLGSLSLVAGQAIKMRDRFTTLGDDGVRSLNGMGRAAKGLGVAMGVATLAVIAWEANSRRQQGSISDSIRLTEQLGRVTDEALGKTFIEAVLAAKLGGESLEEAMRGIAQANLEGAMRVRDNAKALGLSAEFHDALNFAINSEIVARKTQTQVTEKYTAVEEDAAAATKVAAVETLNLKQEMEGGIDTSKVAAQAQHALADQQDAAAASAAEQAEALKDLTAELIAAVESVFDLESATLTLDSAYAAYQESVLATTATLQDSEKTDREKEQALRDLREQEIGVAADALATAQAYAAEAGAADGSAESAQLQKQKLQELAAKFPELRDEIQKYIDKLNTVPGVIRTRFELTVSGAHVTIGGDLIGVRPTTGGSNVAGAAGAIVTRPTLSWLGDAGPEAVIPLNTTPGSSPLSGVGPTVNVYVQTLDGTIGSAALTKLTEAINQGVRTGTVKLAS